MYSANSWPLDLPEMLAQPRLNRNKKQQQAERGSKGDERPLQDPGSASGICYPGDDLIGDELYIERHDDASHNPGQCLQPRTDTELSHAALIDNSVNQRDNGKGQL